MICPQCYEQKCSCGCNSYKTAIIIFAFNRTKCLKRMLKSLGNLELIPADFYAYIDYSEKQKEINKILHKYGIKNRTNRYVKLGLKKNIMSGINETFEHGYQQIIVFEDDLKLKKNAIHTLISMLNLYKDIKSIGSITADYHGNVFAKRFFSHGWGTWKNKWNKYIQTPIKFDYIQSMTIRRVGSDLIDMYEKAEEGKTDSWAIYYTIYHIIEGLRCATPGIKLMKHTGWIGTNYKWYSKLGIRQYFRGL